MKIPGQFEAEINSVATKLLNYGAQHPFCQIDFFTGDQPRWCG
jgi:hypothetical protein